MLAAAQYITLTADETSAVDNLSYIVIHVYVLQDGGTANNLIDMLMGSLELKGGLDKVAIASKLSCFEANGCNAFQGNKNGVTIQIQKNFAPFAS